MTRQSGRRRGGSGSNKSRLSPLLLGAAVILAVVVIGSILGQQNNQGTSGPKSAATQAAASASESATPGLVIPPPAIPLPRSCPPETVPAVDNPARYGFCTPLGWGAYNENNSLTLTLIMEARLGDNPILLPTDFDRIKILLAINTPRPPEVPVDCRGAPNDSIDGLAAHHCTAPLNPDTNPYHAVRVHYWQIDLFQGEQFFMTGQVGGDVTPEEEATLTMVAHNVKPPGH